MLLLIQLGMFLHADVSEKSIWPYIKGRKTMNTIMEQLTDKERNTLKEATRILDSYLTEKGSAFKNPDAVKQFLRLKLSNRSSEHFSVMYLDSQHCLVSYEELFHGTIDSCSVYPRVVIENTLKKGNIAALILGHNHPSSDVTPSQADEKITKTIIEAAQLFNIRVLDHIIIGGSESASFAELGLI